MKRGVRSSGASRRAPTAGGRGIDYQALAELRYQLRSFLVFSEQRARAAGVEPQQHQLLLAIKGLPDALRPTISTLAERLQLKHHTTVGLVDRLVRAKLLLRTRSAVDGREILVRITARGERLLQQLSLSHRAELERAGPALVAALSTVVDVPQRKETRDGSRTGPSARARARTHGRA